jgi:hypothetical protein
MAIWDNVKTYGPRIALAVIVVVALGAAYKYFFASNADSSITGKEESIGSGVRIFYLSSRKEGYNTPDGRITLAPGSKEGEIIVRALVGNTDKGKEAATGFQANRTLSGGSGVFSGKLGDSGKDITVTFAKPTKGGGGTLQIGDDTYTFAPAMP